MCLAAQGIYEDGVKDGKNRELKSGRSAESKSGKSAESKSGRSAESKSGRSAESKPVKTGSRACSNVWKTMRGRLIFRRQSAMLPSAGNYIWNMVFDKTGNILPAVRWIPEPRQLEICAVGRIPGLRRLEVYAIGKFPDLHRLATCAAGRMQKSPGNHSPGDFLLFTG